MSDSDKREYAGAVLEVQEAINALRILHGEQPIDYLPIDQTNSTPVPPLCSFCGKGKNQVRAMVAGPSAHICNECIVLCQSIVSTGD